MKTALIISIILHIIVFSVYAMNYKPAIAEVHIIKNMKVKLGKSHHKSTKLPIKKETPTPVKKPVKHVQKKKIIHKSLTRKIPIAKQKPVEQKSKKKEKHKKIHKNKKYFDPSEQNKVETKGSEFGNKKNAKKDEVNYPELLHLWFVKHLTYPEEVKKLGLEGDAVILFHIKKNGNILSYKLEKKTGFQLLDRIILNTIEVAKPAPPIPSSEKNRRFRLPIRFSLK